MNETDGDEQQRLWTPWRMNYIGGERRPTPPGVSIFSAIAADPSHDAANFVLYRGARAFVVMNLYPYNTGHCMVVPYRQVATLDALDAGEITEIGLLLPWLTRILQTTLRCDGLNIGLNLGAVAGAGVAEHLHWHVVPRWQGDANFMPIVAKTTVMPELLPDTYAKLRATMTQDPAPMLGILAMPPIPQAGGVIFHGDQVVLRAPSGQEASDGAFVFPKGHVEAGESLEEAAIREASEETGLVARTVVPLGTHLFPFKGKMRHVTWFLMEATAETDSFATHLGKDTFLFSPTDAAAKLAHDESRELLRRAVAARERRTKD
ncbi:MAG: NUDIX domain-containing protein [Thermomicrobiales bacterium]